MKILKMYFENEFRTKKNHSNKCTFTNHFKAILNRRPRNDMVLIKENF